MKSLLTLAAFSVFTRARKQHDNIDYVDKYHGEDWYDCGPYGGEHFFSTDTAWNTVVNVLSRLGLCPIHDRQRAATENALPQEQHFQTIDRSQQP
jgi:hypothetical protein